MPFWCHDMLISGLSLQELPYVPLVRRRRINKSPPVPSAASVYLRPFQTITNFHRHQWASIPSPKEAGFRYRGPTLIFPANCRTRPDARNGPDIAVGTRLFILLAHTCSLHHGRQSRARRYQRSYTLLHRVYHSTYIPAVDGEELESD